MKTFEGWLKDNLNNVVDLWQKEQNQQMKPEEKWIVFLARYQDGLTLCCCDESYWETAKKFDGAKTKLFIGSKDATKDWCEARQKFAQVIKAWEDGKEIQCRRPIINTDWVNTPNPTWETELEYRVNPMDVDYPCVCDEFSETEKSDKREEKKKEWWEIINPPQIGQIEYLIKNSKIPKGWYLCDGRKMPKELIGKKRVEEILNKYGGRIPNLRPNSCVIYLGKSEDEKFEYKPYESVEEFIQDFNERFWTAIPRPTHTMPLIWLWDKELDRKCLVRDFESDKVMCGSTSWTMEELFDRWTYLDGSLVGMKVKE